MRRWEKIEVEKMRRWEGERVGGKRHAAHGARRKAHGSRRKAEGR